MIFHSAARRGFGAACWALLLDSLLAACAPRVEAPAPVVSNGAAERGPERVTVQRGDTLSDIAHAHHVPMRVLAEANGLSPPYRIQVGRTLTIPEAGQSHAPAAVSVTALPSTEPGAAAPPPTRLDNSVSNPPAATSVQAASLPPVVSPAREAKGEAATPATNSSAIVPPPAAPSSTAPAPPAAPDPPPSHTGNTFSWPVRGRILAAYGSSSDGTHNDGINIGAPRGAPVQAADAGVVAYTGNELRGYGNLILIKHADGWISAYAHCDQLLVKRGEKVSRGQVIARVGSTGNVSEPQLHFELRHGREAVDPREFLTALPTAAIKDSRSG